MGIPIILIFGSSSSTQKKKNFFFLIQIGSCYTAQVIHKLLGSNNPFDPASPIAANTGLTTVPMARGTRCILALIKRQVCECYRSIL